MSDSTKQKEESNRVPSNTYSHLSLDDVDTTNKPEIIRMTPKVSNSNLAKPLPQNKSNPKVSDADSTEDQVAYFLQ